MSYVICKKHGVDVQSKDCPYCTIEAQNELIVRLKQRSSTAFDNGVDNESERWAKKLAWLSERFEVDCSGLDSGDLLDGVDYTCEVIVDRIDLLEGLLSKAHELFKEYEMNVDSDAPP